MGEESLYNGQIMEEAWTKDLPGLDGVGTRLSTNSAVSSTDAPEPSATSTSVASVRPEQQSEKARALTRSLQGSDCLRRRSSMDSALPPASSAGDTEREADLLLVSLVLWELVPGPSSPSASVASVKPRRRREKV